MKFPIKDTFSKKPQFYFNILYVTFSAFYSSILHINLQQIIT